jgi:hypothetical protein
MPRYALQAELYGLTQAQRTSGATAVNNAFDSGKLVGEKIVDDNKTIHGQVCLFVEANFDSRAEGDRIFGVARSWASTRSTDAADGRHSYVRLREVDEANGLIHTRYAESPGWVAQDLPDEQLRIAR